ncbi:MAG: hypothetical protein Q8O37_13740 [Sulfuricellaceae bacterium]|nr:hypothetical protein [Sulfuricellaceae bacterium]
MTDHVSTLRLQDAWRECERNIYHLCRALTSLDPILPMTGEAFEHLTDAQVQSVDQFILRFTKLQDAMGSRLLPAILQYLQEPYEERPMLDKLNRLEKLGYIQNAEAWQNIRNTRNKFAHDYPDDGERNAALINLACEAAGVMHNILTGIDKKLKMDQSNFEFGRSLSVAYPKQSPRCK